MSASKLMTGAARDAEEASANVSATHHLGRLVDLTTGDMPSLYRLLVLEKLTTLKMTL